MYRNIKLLILFLVINITTLTAQLRDGAHYYLKLATGVTYIWPAHGEGADRVLLQVSQKSESNQQKFLWKAVSAGDGWFYLIHVPSGLAMDLRQRNSSIGNQLWLQPRNRENSQKFKFILDREGLYKMQNRLASTRRIGVNTQNNNMLRLEGNARFSLQYWKLEYANANRDAFGNPFNFSRMYSDENTRVYMQVNSVGKVFGVMEEGNVTYVFQGEVEPQSNGKVYLNNEYYAIPKGRLGKDYLEDPQRSIGKIIVERNGTAISYVTRNGRKAKLHQLYPNTARTGFDIRKDAGFQAYGGLGLTGVWEGDNNATYYIHQLGGAKVVWFGEEDQISRQAFANVFIGEWKRLDNRRDEFGRRISEVRYEIEGEWVDVPKGNRRGEGKVTFVGNSLGLNIRRNEPLGRSEFMLTHLKRMRYLKLEITSLSAQSTDACGEMDFYGVSRFNGYQTRHYRQRTGNELNPSDWSHQVNWPGREDVPIKISFSDKDSGLRCGGGDDKVDINPQPGTDEEDRSFDLHLRVLPGGTIHHMNKIGNRGTRIGDVGFHLSDEVQTFRMMGNNRPGSREESAIIEFKLTWSYVRSLP